MIHRKINTKDCSDIHLLLLVITWFRASVICIYIVFYLVQVVKFVVLRQLFKKVILHLCNQSKSNVTIFLRPMLRALFMLNLLNGLEAGTQG